MTDQDATSPDHAPFVAMLRLTDTVTPWAVRAVATLRIPDLMAAGTSSTGELATRAGVDADALGRLLRFLALHGVFAELGPEEFGLTPLSRLMVGDHPTSMRPWWDLEGAMARLDQTSVRMAEAIRTGGPVYETIFGRNLWDDLASDPALAASFDRAMTHKTLLALDALVDGYDWGRFGHIVDVGGGSGTLLAAVLGAHPDMRGTLVERNATIERNALSDRIGYLAGNFFDELPPGADAYVLLNVVHNWGDTQATAILRRCAEATGRHGRVLVIETVVGAGGDEAGLARLDLLMLLTCGGRERTSEQYAELAEKAGLALRSVHPTGSGLSILELDPLIR